MRVKINDEIINAEITTAHSASSYGIPVLVIGNEAYGPAEVSHIELLQADQAERDALKKAGYWV